MTKQWEKGLRKLYGDDQLKLKVQDEKTLEIKNPELTNEEKPKVKEIKRVITRSWLLKYH